MQFNTTQLVRRLFSRRNRLPMNSLALTGSLLAFTLHSPSAVAQQANGPIRVHTSSTPSIPPYSPMGWQEQAVVPASQPLLGQSNGQPIHLAAHEDFSVPTAGPAHVPSRADVKASVAAASESSPLFKTASTTRIISEATPVGLNNSIPASPVASSQVIGEPLVVGPEVIVDGEYPMMGEPMFQDPGYYAGAPYSGRPQFAGPNIGYDPLAMNGCGPENCRLYYASVEALYWKQEEDQSLGFSAGRNLSEFDFEWGSRVTIGEMLDCVNGWEFVFTGPFKWTRTRDLVGPGLNSTFTTVPPLLSAPTLFDTFFDSNVHNQSLETKLSTYEINRRWFASDLFSTSLGLSIIDYDEEYNFLAVGQNNAVGLFRNKIENCLIGAQFGSTMYQPLTQRFSYGGWGKLGVYANFAENDTFLQNGPNIYADARRSDTSIAGVVQGGLGARYRILPSLTITGSYDAMIIAGTATVANQSTFPFSQTSPNNVDQDDIVMFHGASVGAEFSY